MEMRRPRSRVAHVLEGAFVAKATLRVLCLCPAEKQQHLVAVLLVFNQHLVGAALALAVHMEVIPLQPVVVLRHVAGLLLRDEQPN